MSEAPSITQQKTVRSILIPTDAQPLLLPNAAVAEVVDPQRLRGARKSTPWLLGVQAWRNHQVPVVRFEHLAGLAYEPPRVRSRIAICHSLRPQGPHFIGVLAHAIPRLVLINESKIQSEQATGLAENAPVLGSCRIGEELALIPNVTLIADLIAGMIANKG